jgi:hypothetical protein
MQDLLTTLQELYAVLDFTAGTAIVLLFGLTAYYVFSILNEPALPGDERSKWNE